MREFGTREERSLLVEDEEPIRDLVTAALRFTGFAVETAATSPQGLALARNDAWHMLVLDVNLPGLAEFSLCRTWLAAIRIDGWRKSRLTSCSWPARPPVNSPPPTRVVP